MKKRYIKKTIMGYYIAKVSFESGEVKKNGDPVLKKVEFLVEAQSVLEVESKVSDHLKGTVGFFETVQVSKSKIESVIE
jgi:hypothetical protein